MWLGIPLALVYAASQLADTSAPTLGPYLLVFIGLPIGMAIMAKLLGYLDHVHQCLHAHGRRPPAAGARGCARCAASAAPPASAACSTR